MPLHIKDEFIMTIDNVGVPLGYCVLSRMLRFLVATVLLLSASAVPQLPEYAGIEAEYGEIPFEIATDNYYPSDWQRINGDPHGQAAEKEAPDALGDETLSFDFPNDDTSYNVFLWSYPGGLFDIRGNVTNKQLHTIDIVESYFDVYFDDVSISLMNITYADTYTYGDDFDVLLESVSGARVRSTGVLNNIRFEYYDYVFIIIGPGGIYEPEYSVTGNLQQSMSITMIEGDITVLDALMGQIDGYWIYAPLDPQLGDLALAKADINGVLTLPFPVRRSRHLGKYKKCWHYGSGTDTRHAIIGQLSNFIVPP